MEARWAVVMITMGLFGVVLGYRRPLPRNTIFFSHVDADDSDTVPQQVPHHSSHSPNFASSSFFNFFLQQKLVQQKLDVEDEDTRPSRKSNKGVTTSSITDVFEKNSNFSVCTDVLFFSCLGLFSSLLCTLLSRISFSPFFLFPFVVP